MTFRQGSHAKRLPVSRSRSRFPGSGCAGSQRGPCGVDRGHSTRAPLGNREEQGDAPKSRPAVSPHSNPEAAGAAFLLGGRGFSSEMKLPGDRLHGGAGRAGGGGLGFRGDLPGSSPSGCEPGSSWPPGPLPGVGAPPRARAPSVCRMPPLSPCSCLRLGGYPEPLCPDPPPGPGPLLECGLEPPGPRPPPQPSGPCWASGGTFLPPHGSASTRPRYCSC